MSGAPHSPLSSSPRVVPLPRRPLDPAGPGASGRIRRWYENELGWPTVPGNPVRLAVGARFDVLDVPAEAGHSALRHLGPHSPVALRGGRMLLLVSAGSAEELPGLLQWLEWGTLPLDLTALGPGGTLPAPLPPWTATAVAGTPRPGTDSGVDTPFGPDGTPGITPRAATGTPHGVTETEHDPAGLVGSPLPVGPGTPRRAGGPVRPASGSDAGRPLPLGRLGSQGAAVWLRPPEPGCEVEASLPTLSALGGVGGAPDLVRLVNTVATQCHRIRLRGADARPPALPARGR
ncbi:SCO3374 family protein [Streptomyces sp. NPDC006624]|uniref:SCO3374 family protein n=1 Tax=Streptomyces sp. NPDC006624 TaxID=3154892 RepID=UPI0033A67DD0